MTLEAWVNPTAVTSAWRDVIVKGDDDYYLDGNRRTASARSEPAIFGGVKARAYRHVAPSRSTPGRIWRRRTTARIVQAVRERRARRDDAQDRERSGPRSTRCRSAVTPSTASTSPGCIDEVRVYNGALTQAQVQTDMNTPIGGASPPDTQPPTAPSNLQATASGATQIGLTWTASHRQRRRDRVPGRALPGRGLLELRADRHARGIDLHRHRTRSEHELQLPRARDRRAGNLSPYSNTATATTQAQAGDTQPPTAPSEPAGDGERATQIEPDLDGLDRQRRRDRLPGRALPGRGLLELRADRHAAGIDLHRHRAHSQHELQLPRARSRRSRQPRPLLEHGDRDDAGSGWRHAAADGPERICRRRRAGRRRSA